MKLGIHRFTPQDIFKDTRAEIFFFWQWLKWILTFNPAAQHIGKLKTLLKVTVKKKKKPLQQYSLNCPQKSWSVECDWVYFSRAMSHQGWALKTGVMPTHSMSWKQGELGISASRLQLWGVGSPAWHECLAALAVGTVALRLCALENYWAKKPFCRLGTNSLRSL